MSSRSMSSRECSGDLERNLDALVIEPYVGKYCHGRDQQEELGVHGHNAGCSS